MRSAAQHGGKHLILGLTRESVRGAFWSDVLKQIDATHPLRATFNETRLEMLFPNGGTVRLLGMDSNDQEKKKALGQKYRMVNIDEAQDFRTDLEQLVYSTLLPAVSDLSGQISLSGTPSNNINGLFFDITNGRRPDWSVHRWTTEQNTAIPADSSVRMCDAWANQIAELVASNPRVREAPWFRQNYLGEWVIETDALVYRYRQGRNDGVPPALPARGWHYVLGVDLGYTDASSFTLMAYHDHSRTFYVLESNKESGLDITAVAGRIRAYSSKYNLERIVIDNANKQAVEEMKQRHDLPLHPADKTGKSDFIELLNADLITGQLMISPGCDQLTEELKGLIWDPKSSRREEHPACPNHCCDSMLYAWRYCYAHLSVIPIPKPKQGSQEQIDQEIADMERAAEMEYIRNRDDEYVW